MRRRSWPAAILLLLNWCAPVHAAALFAQGDGGTPLIAYGVGILATALVLLVVCWPARRE